ncbi:MAG: ssk1 response regulator receiver [Alyxoria varia]|nr:MAG: ssk1 response regulator receiver [Alyxoria varia]
MLEAVRLMQNDDSHGDSSEVDLEGPNKAALTIGLGIGTCPAALSNHGIKTLAVEIDPAVSAFATKYFGLPGNVTVVNDDAVRFTTEAERRHQRFDYIVHDVFTGGAEPVSLFTFEFLQSLKNLLKDDGSIAINYAADLKAHSTAAVLHTVLSAFGSCKVFRDQESSDDGIDADFANIVLFCKKSDKSWGFRPTVEADFLRSEARRQFLVPKHKINVNKLCAGLGEDNIVRDGNTAILESTQAKSAMDHWKIMRQRQFSDPPGSGPQSSSPTTSRGEDHGSPKPREKASFPSLRKGITRSNVSAPASQVGKDTKCPAVDDLQQQTLDQQQMSLSHNPKPPTLTVQEPSPDLKTADDKPASTLAKAGSNTLQSRPEPTPSPLSRTISARPSLTRSTSRQSFTGNSEQKSEAPTPKADTQDKNLASSDHERPTESNAAESSHRLEKAMAKRKIWVRRPGASATLVQISSEDLVDDVRDMILRKYANSLGRNFDSPDVTIKVQPRPQHGNERVLGPEESICRVLDESFPDGQYVTDALIIDVPQRRTPKPSPRHVIPIAGTHYEDHRPLETGTDYFPPMPPASPHSSHHDPRLAYHAHSSNNPHSIAILETGQLPALPSPGARTKHHRPRIGRQHTSSPTIVNPSSANSYNSQRQQRPRRDSNNSLRHGTQAPAAPPLPTSPAAEIPGANSKVGTPPLDRTTSPRPPGFKTKKARKSPNGNHSIQQPNSHDPSQLSLGGANAPILNGGALPPINVLIVEDNIINLKLLEAFVKRLKVRWSTAMNGREAVTKWRQGGFHLVLMDIQLPIMSGLDATKEIRRLERVNSIGVFAKSEGAERAPSPAKQAVNGDGKHGAEGDDKLQVDTGVFKSPVIIVALTASSLQSDRHEALAAGCNDFLTKPVNFLWLERKVMEWGCMQALIDFDGWRKWKDFEGLNSGGESVVAGAVAGKGGCAKKEETEEEREKREKKEAKRMAILAKMGQA